MIKKNIIIICFLSILLSGCSQKPVGTDVEVSESAIIVNSGDSTSYNTVAPMVQSPSRGISNEYASDNLDIENMENGLMEISKMYASPEEYYYQSGQVISSDDASALLNREYTEAQFNTVLEEDYSAQNIGINPVLEDGANPTESKIYASTIIEQDYYTLDAEGNKSIDTISIAFGINTTYEVEYNGEVEQVTIENKELMDYGNAYIANRMTTYIRSLDGMEDVQIVYAFYIQSQEASIPGNYFAYTSVNKGENTLQPMQTIDEEFVLFPSSRGQELDSDLNNSIESLSANVYNYFPTASGTYAYGFYKDDTLQSLEIIITADIYSSVETKPFVSFLEQEIPKTINTSVPIKVQIKRPDGTPLAVISFENQKVVESYIY